MRKAARPILFTIAGIALFVGLLAWVLELAHHSLTTVGWIVAIVGPLLAAALSFAATAINRP